MKLMLTILILLAAPLLGNQSVKLSWDASMSGGVTGYKIYDGIASHTYTNVVDAGNATHLTVNGLLPGATYYFAATAYNGLGQESIFSNETSCTVPAMPPQPSLATGYKLGVFKL